MPKRRLSTPSLALAKSPVDPDVDRGAREPGVLRRDMGLVLDSESLRQCGPVRCRSSRLQAIDGRSKMK